MSALSDAKSQTTDLLGELRRSTRGEDAVMLEVSSVMSRDPELSPIAQGLEAAASAMSPRFALMALLRGVFRLLRNLRFSMSMWTSRKRPTLPESDVVLLDCFVLPSQIQEGLWHDRYYNGLTDLVPGSGVRFVPTFLMWSGLGRVRKAMERADVSFLFPQDFLGLNDYFSALMLPVIMKRLYRVPGAHLDPLVRKALKAEWWNGLWESATFRSWLLYRAMVRMEERGVSVRRAIDWNENQPVDRGFVLGVRRSWPAATIAGFRGYLASTDRRPHLIPAREEREAGGFPDELFVMGQGEASRWRQLVPGIRVEQGPSLRYGHVFATSTSRGRAASQSVLVALPVFKDEARLMVESVLSAFKEASLAPEVAIQPHPSMDLESMGVNPATWPDHIHPVSGRLSDLLERFGILVTSSSSGTGLEALALGNRVIYLNGAGDPPMDIPLDDEALSSVVRWAPDSVQLTDAVVAFSESVPDERASSAIRDAYFTRPVQSVASLLVNGAEDIHSREAD